MSKAQILERQKLFNLIIKNCHDVLVAGIKDDVKIIIRSLKQEFAVVVHLAFDQHALTVVEDADGNAFGGNAIGKSTLADDRVITIVKTKTDRAVRQGRQRKH